MTTTRRPIPLRDLWMETFDEVVERTNDSLLASKEADDAVADALAAQADEAYDRWRDMEVMNELR
jgi:hypothetical protein